MAHHHREVALAPDLHLENAKAVLGIVEGDALDGARQSLKRRPLIALSSSKYLVHDASRPALKVRIVQTRHYRGTAVQGPLAVGIEFPGF